MLVAIVAVLVALLADTPAQPGASTPAPAAGAAPPATAADLAIDCTQLPTVSAAVSRASGVYQGGNPAGALQIVDAVIAQCGATPVTWPPRILGALIALAINEHDRGLALLEPVPREGEGWVSTHAAYARLRLLQAEGDAATFGRERQILVQSAVAALTGARIHGRLQEAFSESGAQVWAVEATLDQDSFLRHWEFLIIPAAPLEMPRSIMISSDRVADELGDAALFIDGYDCESHTTLQVIPARPQPQYAAIKAVVVAALRGQAHAVSGMHPGDSGICAWPAFVTPGLSG
jgi:hypothetical protein